MDRAGGVVLRVNQGEVWELEVKDGGEEWGKQEELDVVCFL